MSSKKDIILLALKIFLQKGYDSTSINDITSESHISKGGLHYHFKNKDEIFFEAVDYLFEEFEEYGKSLFTDSKDIKEILNTYFNSLTNIEDILKDISGSKNIKMINYYMLMTNAILKFPRVKKKYLELHKMNQNLLLNVLMKAQQQGEIESTVDCYTISSIINLIVEGFMTHHVTMQEIEIKENCEKIFHYIWNGISPNNKKFY